MYLGIDTHKRYSQVAVVLFDGIAIFHTITDEFDRFRDIITADGTIFRLHEFLSDVFQPRKGGVG